MLEKNFVSLASFAIFVKQPTVQRKQAAGLKAWRRFFARVEQFARNHEDRDRTKFKDAKLSLSQGGFSGIS